MCATLRGALHRTIHGSRIDYVVAALSADPETIEELQTALARFLPSDEQRAFFDGWRSGTRVEPWDAGLAIIDLPARLVIVESSYSAPGPSGAVDMADPRKDENVRIPYHVAEDWLFTDQSEGWEMLADKRRQTRPSLLDARAVLYGRICAFSAQACWAPATEVATLDDASVHDALSAVHARWLTTPRADLGGQAPRDLLLARNGHIGWDLQDRSQQWSFLGTCPPGLSRETTAYRYGGFGTHEIVLYYDLVRYLLTSSWQRRANQGATGITTAALEAEIARLEGLRDEWLETPDFEDLHGRTPASVIARERQRLPEGVTGAEAMVDHDCPPCQMMAEDPGPMFWHLDGCNMDDDFAFSFHRTRAEWEAERSKWEEFNRKFDEEWRAKQATAGADVWQTSYVDTEAIGQSPALTLFGLGARLAELTQDLKDAGAEPAVLDSLGRAFGNLREAVSDPTAALVEPATLKMCETLDAIAEAHLALGDKCTDLGRQLKDFASRLTDEPFPDEDVPF